jgi:hypothetical protein
MRAPVLGGYVTILTKKTLCEGTGKGQVHSGHQ